MSIELSFEYYADTNVTNKIKLEEYKSEKDGCQRKCWKRNRRKIAHLDEMVN